MNSLLSFESLEAFLARVAGVDAKWRVDRISLGECAGDVLALLCLLVIIVGAVWVLPIAAEVLK